MSTSLETITQNILDVLREHARLPLDPALLTEQESLYDAGMTSYASVSVMVALEERFDIEFPDSMLNRAVFENRGSIRSAIARLLAD